MNKRAQVTTYIIIGILIIAIVLGSYYTMNKIRGTNQIEKIAKDSSTKIELYSIKNQIDQCTQQVISNAILLSGLQGGYIFLPENSFKLGSLETVYAYSNGKNTLPSLREVQTELEAYISLMVLACTDFNNPNIQVQSMDTQVKLESNYVTTTINMPVTLKKEDASYTLDEAYVIENKVRLKQIYEEANRVISEGISRNNLYIDKLASDQFSNSFYYSENDLIFTLQDYDFKINQKPLTFIFAVKNEK